MTRKDRLVPKVLHITLRMASLILLVSIAPFALAGMYHDGKLYAVLFFSVMLTLLIPELLVKLFSIPVSGFFNETQLTLIYLLKKQQQIKFNDIQGYSFTEEQSIYKIKHGLLLYLNTGRKIHLTEINIADMTPLTHHLKNFGFKDFGVKKLGPWYRRYPK